MAVRKAPALARPGRFTQVAADLGKLIILSLVANRQSVFEQLFMGTDGNVKASSGAMFEPGQIRIEKEFMSVGAAAAAV